jgi:hypothetical protein
LAEEDNLSLLSVLKWTTPADVAPATLLDEFTTAVGAYRWAATNTPSKLPPPAALETLASFSPPSTRQDRRQTERTIATFRQREGKVVASIEALRAYRADIESRRSTVMASFVRLSTGLLSASGDLDLENGPDDESIAYASAAEDLTRLSSDADLRPRYDQYLLVISTRNTLIRAIEAERLEQQRLEQQRLEQQRLEQQRLEQQRLEQQQTPPPVEPAPAPSEPTQGPNPTPEPEPEPTVPVPDPTPTTPPDGGQGGGPPTDSTPEFEVPAS